ncbi:hypothetical protein ETU09_07970 [Apibacter muscae]|uniref:Uncharacterized protein n=1 Tax=Apibacter muscae TaxID=2509004 RepID=A0A563DBS4_9FLAO|nr:hypothetical protein [Apibacter muscae]TWP27371.1 hypothetical protein ETU09_07970 [Apibacter muscae]
MKKLNILYILIISSIFVFCQKSNINKESQPLSQIQSNLTSKKEDSVIVPTTNMVFLIYPSQKTVDSLKLSLGDDFYTIADDANYYDAQIMEYLDSLHIPYINVSDSIQLVLRKKNNPDLMILKNNVNPWYAILYNEDLHRYKISNLVDFTSNYKNFYSSKIKSK